MKKSVMFFALVFAAFTSVASASVSHPFRMDLAKRDYVFREVNWGMSPQEVYDAEKAFSSPTGKVTNFQNVKLKELANDSWLKRAVRQPDGDMTLYYVDADPDDKYTYRYRYDFSGGKLNAIGVTIDGKGASFADLQSKLQMISKELEKKYDRSRPLYNHRGDEGRKLVQLIFAGKMTSKDAPFVDAVKKGYINEVRNWDRGGNVISLAVSDGMIGPVFDWFGVKLRLEIKKKS